MESTDISYDDFSIRFEPQRRGGYPFSITSPAGHARAEMRVPFSPDQIQAFREELEHQIRRDVHNVQAVKDFGARLFDALFADRRAIRLFERHRGMVEREPSRRLRIKLHFIPDVSELSMLPWEFLYDTEFSTFLGRSADTPIVRYLNVPRPMHRTQLPGLPKPLSVLAVLSGPKDQVELRLDKEKAVIEQAMTDLRREGLVALEYLIPPTLEKLHQRCSDKSYFVLHFSGHGGFMDGQPVIYFEHEDGLSHPVSGEALAAFLQDQRELQFVFLNACKTSNIISQRGVDPFSSMAAALVSAGVPAVLAMQFPITDPAAIKFSQEVYRKLAEGCLMDTAVASGRKAIFAWRTTSFEWGTPVLFTHIPDGRLFHVERGTVRPSLSIEEIRDPPVSVRDVIIVRFTPEELRDFCISRLGMDYDGLPGRNIATKASGVIEYALEHNMLLELVQKLREDRPDIAELESIEVSLLRELEEEYAEI